MPIWIIYAFLSAVFAALVAIFSKKSLSLLHDLDHVIAATIQALIMAIFLIIVSVALNKFQLIGHIDRRAFFFMLLAGLSGALSWLSYFYALKEAPNESIPAVAALDRMSVIFVFLFGILILGDQLTLTSAAGALSFTLGVTLLTLK